MSKVLVLGPGATRLGDADAFDMAIVEAVSALRTDGHDVVVVTPRLSAPVCVGTGALYVEPLTPASVQAIVAKEKPDHVLSTLGGLDARTAVDLAASEPVDARHEGDGAELEVIVARDGSGAARVVGISELVCGRGIASGDAIAVFPPRIDEEERAEAESAALEAFRSVGTVSGALGTVRLGLPDTQGSPRILAVRSWYTRGVAFAARALGIDLGAAFARLALGATLGAVFPSPPARRDLVVVRVPRFSFEPFGSRALDGTPKSTGEAYGVGSTFHEAWLHAVRALDRPLPRGDHRSAVDGRLEHLLGALRGRGDAAELARAAEVRPWIVDELAAAVAVERAFLESPGDAAAILAAKRAGFSDAHLASASGRTEQEMRDVRHAHDVVPRWRVVHGNVGALTYDAGTTPPRAELVVEGPGPTRIGRTSEVESCTVEGLLRLRERRRTAVLVHTAPRGPAAATAESVCLGALDGETLSDLARLVGATTTLAPLAAVDRGTPIVPADARKVDVDLLCDRTHACVCGVVEYVERAAVHAGDSAAFVPPQLLAPELQRLVEARAKEAALALGRPGAVRVRVAIAAGDLQVVEAAAGASTTLALHSRVSGAFFAIDAIDLMLGAALERTDAPVPPFVVARECVLPFRFLDTEDTRLGSAMCSTGHGYGFADTVPRAYAKALASVGVALKRPSIERPVALLVFAGAEKSGAVDVARRLRALGFELRVKGVLGDMLRAMRIPHELANADPFARADVGLAIVSAAADAENEDTRALRRHAMQSAVPYVTTIELALAVCAVLEESGVPAPIRFR